MLTLVNVFVVQFFHPVCGEMDVWNAPEGLPRLAYRHTSCSGHADRRFFFSVKKSGSITIDVPWMPWSQCPILNGFTVFYSALLILLSAQLLFLIFVSFLGFQCTCLGTKMFLLYGFGLSFLVFNFIPVFCHFEIVLIKYLFVVYIRAHTNGRHPQSLTLVAMNRSISPSHTSFIVGTAYPKLSS